MAGYFNQSTIRELVAAASEAGKSLTKQDSANLYLQATPTSDGSVALSWLFRYQVGTRRRKMGLGSYPTVSASNARSERDRLRKLTKAGIDPLMTREADKAAQKAAVLQEKRDAVTFKECAQAFIATKESEWKNSKHHQQWGNTLKTYAYPKIGHLPVNQITTELVLDCLTPIWIKKTETAKRLQGRIERILDYAKVMEYREGENPARWRGHLENTLPRPGKVQRVQHQRALNHSEAPALAKAINELETPASRALLVTMLCATRTTETLEATWDELDLESKLWTIAADRMKAGKPHRIPLTDATVRILKQQGRIRRDNWVFHGQKLGRPLSNMAMSNVLKRTSWLDKTTVHGLRSTFRDWVSDCTNYPDRLAEVALAHQLSDRVQAAYNRTDQLEKRREMMASWSQHLFSEKGKVLNLPSAIREN